ncbi:MAG TPA: type VI secretion system tube protein Hcp [Vineibacter sp.]|nr:type VI secretion system tube protein Hcp [Vineibacter sp.]
MSRSYLKVDGVPGDVRDPNLFGFITVTSLSWPEPRNGSGGGGGAGRFTTDRLSTTVPAGPHAHVLYVKCAAGEHIRQAELRMFKERGQFVAARMSDILVDSCTSLADGQANVVFTFANVTFSQGTMAR